MNSYGDGLEGVACISAREHEAFAAASFRTVRELLEHFPKRYEDRRRFDTFPTQGAGPPVCLRGTVIDSAKRHFGRQRGFFEAIIMKGAGGVFGSDKITCRWFNMPYIHRMIATGQEVVVYGKVKDLKGRLVMDHPEFEIIDEGETGGESIHVERIVPIYRNVSGIPQRRLREIIHGLLRNCAEPTMDLEYDVSPETKRSVSVRDAHFPENIEDAQLALRRFALEEFLRLQLNVAWRRQTYCQQTGRILGKRTELLTRFYQSLPFDLTEAQKRSIREIIADMRMPRPMNRLLQGDVGAGKTFVAMAAMLLAVDAGCQAALMAPTQILAEQHYLTFRRWLDPLGVRISLRTGNRRDDSHIELDGQPQMIIGTHALLFDEDIFRDLGLVVIDEQHKFGVAQRSKLIHSGVTPDVLVMTATPIPRTLTMTIYGDLDVSLLDEKPAGRGRIVTAVRTGAKQSDVTAFVKSQLAEGRQAYLVYPLVEESETLDVESATEAFEKWRKRLSGHTVGLIHGKLKPEEKESVMSGFRAGEIHALVSTTVIEVGVDVPNASLMILHHAERFGLAQLHQLRGRIGRGGSKSYCVLLTDGKNPESMEKLRVLEQSSDGFVIAEADLRLRGPGDVLGTAQSGLANLKFADFLADTQLLRQAREMADRILIEDPRLESRHRGLRAWILDGDSLVPIRTA